MRISLADIMIPWDKCMHIIVGQALAVPGLLWGGSLGRLLAYVTVVAFAVGREVYNRRQGGKFDLVDIGATVAGGVEAILVSMLGAEGLL